MNRRHFIAAAAAATTGAFAVGPARAVVVEGVRFDERVRVAGADLVLNGTGIRAVAWFKGYVAALYLRERTQAADAAVAQPGPKRIRMAMLHGAPAGEFIKAVNKGVARNVAADALPRMQPHLARFGELMDSVVEVKKGDLVDLDFHPGRGLVFSMNGKPVGEPIAGDDFYAALLRSFIGERPYAKDLRAGMLGQPAPPPAR